MYWKHKLQIYLICVLIGAYPCFSKTLLESVRDIISFKLPDNLFASVNDNIRGKLQAKNIKFVLPNKIEIDDMEVLDDQGERMLYGKHVKLTLSLISLMTDNIRITDAYVDSPFFRYTINKGSHNVTAAFEPRRQTPQKGPAPKEKSSTRVTIENIAVENGNYEMFHDAGVEIFAEGISAQGTFFVEKGPFGVDLTKVHIEKGAILTGGMDLPLTNLVVNGLWISDEKVSTTSLTAFYEKAILNASGTVFINEKRYDILANLDAPKNTYPNGLKPLPFIAPAFNAHVKMAGTLVEPEFLVHMDLKNTDFRGLKINHGKLDAHITRHQVAIDAGQLQVGKKGWIFGSGVIDIDNQKYQFVSKEKDILGEELAQFLSFKQKSHGVIDASTKFDGKFSSNEQNIHIVSSGKVFNGEIDKIRFADETDVTIDLNLILDKSVSIKKALIADKLGLRLAASGEGDLTSNALNLNFDLVSHNLGLYVPLPSQTDTVHGLRARGHIAYDKDALFFKAPLSIDAIGYANFFATDVGCDLELSKKRLFISNLTAKAYQGTLNGVFSVDDLDDQRSLTGNLVLRGMDLYALSRPFVSMNLGGTVSSSLEIGGNVTHPRVEFLTEIDGLVVDNAKFTTAQFEGKFEHEKLVIPKCAILARSGLIEGQDLRFDVDTRAIGGSLIVTDLNIAGSFSKYVSQLDGDLDGPVTIEGTLESPVLFAPLVANKLSAYGVNLGGGAVTLALARRPLLGKNNERDLVFSVSSNLQWRESNSIARFALALNKKTINAELDFNDLEVNTTQSHLANTIFAVAGRVSGNIFAEGPLKSPVLSAHLVAKEYGFFDPKKRDAVNNIKKHGPAVLNARINGGGLKLDLCASFLAPTGGILCEYDQALSLFLSGPFSLDEFALNLEGGIDHSHLEDLLRPLKTELITIDAAAGFKGKLIKKIHQPVSINANVHLERLKASLPNIPNVVLTEPITLAISNDTIEFGRDAVLDFSPGLLTMGGSYSFSAIDGHLQGAIPLVLTRLFFPVVQRAEGLAMGDITLSGSADALIIEGKIIPEANSSVTLRKWLEPIEVKEGGIAFERTSPTSFVTRFENIRLGVGDGRLFLNGSFDKHYAKNVSVASIFDLELQGSNIVLRDGLNFVEADFNIKTKQAPESSSVAEGDVTITDGSAHRQFDLRNFVAQAQTDTKPGFLKFLEDIDMRLNLDIAVRQFRASARMLNLDIDSILRGQMTVEGPIYHPKFKGSLFVSEGAIMFPSLSFDLMESQIVLEENSSRIFDPKIEIVASQELEKTDYPQIGQDTTIELSLRGNLDRLSLELRPIRGNLRLSQLKIFLLLLSPRTVAEGDQSDRGDDQYELLKRGAQNAAMAFSGEVFLRPLTNELQELLEGKTRTRIQFGSALESGGVTLRLNWKLGPRIELQGSYMFLTEEARSLGRTKSDLMIDNQTLLGDLKLKLLLFDHPPAGPLSLEASFGSTKQVEGQYEPRGKIRLKYRVLSK